MRKAPAGGIVRTSLANDWKTPPHILDAAREFFGGRIPFDPATAPDNPTDAEVFCAGAPGTLFAQDLPDDDMARRNGLEVRWTRPTWVNPPYGRELKAWLGKIVTEANRCTTIVALLPCSRWEQGYLQDVLDVARAACFIRGRVAFISAIDGQAVGGNPTASMLLGFNVELPAWRDAFSPLGRCLALRALGAP